MIAAAMADRFIAHLDMDAFYASVELLRYPELRGKPVVIGGRRRLAQGTGATLLRDYVGRGVITTATYEARAFGLGSGMGLMKAARLAPGALLLPADFDEYRRYSQAFKDAVRALAPEIEDRGIDEIYIDLTALVQAGADALRTEWPCPKSAEEPPAGYGEPDDSRAAWQRAREIGAAIQRAVHHATGLSCSIGITPNKLLSKIASDLDKPGGLTILRTDHVPQRIWPLPVRKLHGIGPKASARLEALHIRTIGELAGSDRELLLERFGRSFGAWLHDAAHGRDERPVVTWSEPKSISRETTFERDLHPVRDRAVLSDVFTDLCIRVAADLERKGYLGRTIGLKLRYDNFRTVTREVTLERATADSAMIRRAAGACLKRVPLDRRIRLLGVRVAALAKSAAALAQEETAPAACAPLPAAAMAEGV
jgi:DNA polymerase IV